MNKQNKQLIAYRKMINMSQTDMAKAIGICLTSYHLKETGKKDFTQSEMVSILNIIKKYNPNITIDEIFFSKTVSIMITI